MKLSFLKSELSEALKLLMPIVPSRSTVPVLGSLHVGPGSSPCTVNISATNMEQNVSVETACEADGDQAFLIPARKLSSIVSAAKSEFIEISAGKKTVEIKCGASAFTLDTLPAEDFPEEGLSEAPNTIRIDSLDLLSLLTQTRHASSTDETRHILCGVNLEVGGGTIAAIATDGRRLACCSIEAATPEAEIGLVLPSPAVNEICKMLTLAEEPGEVVVEINSNRAAIRFNRVKLLTKLIDGNYPNWRHVVPAGGEHTISLARADLLDTVNQVRIMCDADASLAVHLAFSKGFVQLSTEAGGVGRAEGLLQFNNGFELAISCSPQFLADALKATDADEMEFILSDSISPILLKSGPLTQVIMPIRVG